MTAVRPGTTWLRLSLVETCTVSEQPSIEAINQLTAVAAQMRAMAAQYGFTEDTNTGDVTAQGTTL